MDILDIAKEIKSILQEIPGSRSDCAKIDDYISQLESRSVNVCVSGEFSSGKSSLINSLIAYPLLPVSDLPLTSTRTEIVHSVQPYLSCWWGEGLSREASEDLLKALSAAEEGRGAGSGRKLRERISWCANMTQMSYRPLDVLSIKNFLWMFEAAQHRQKDGLSKVGAFAATTAAISFIRRLWASIERLILPRDARRKNEEKNSRNPFEGIEKVEIGLPLPDSIKDSHLLDVPGEGSIYRYSANGKRATETAQIVLHVFDAEHVGSKLTDEMIAEGGQNNATRIYVLNKMDVLSDASLKEILSLLREKYRLTPIAVSALYGNGSHLLSNNLCSVEKLILENHKINLARVMMSKEWDHNNVENNKPLVADFLHKTSNCQTLTERLSSHIKTAKRSLAESCSEELLKICKMYLQKTKALAEAVERRPQRQAFQEKISSIRKVCQDVEKFRDETVRKFQFDFKSQIKSALNNLLKQFDNVLSDSLMVSFGEFEDHLENAIASSFSFPASCEIKNVIDTFFAQHKTRSEACISALSLQIPVSAFSPVKWTRGPGFRSRIQLRTGEIVGSILQDKTDRPWFAFLRGEAMGEYKRKKHQQCMRQWRRQIPQVFAAEEEVVINLYSQALEERLMPFMNLKSQKEAELKSTELSLTCLENDISSDEERIRLCKIQSDLTRQIDFLNSEGEKQ